jgi:hypothetical protein
MGDDFASSGLLLLITAGEAEVCQYSMLCAGSVPQALVCRLSRFLACSHEGTA